ncbi:tyrosine-type recombinase/integrase [Paenibacillus alvei]|uniref:tyrosine-type recombinase/integrase n=1 Tax=Paenibacillus alvei TaxID=44250 RepID=UPI003AF2CC76
MHPSQLRHDYEKIINKRGLPYIRFHDLRHSFATNLWELGFDLKDIQEVLGHSSVAITGDIYTHMRDEKKKNLMAKYSEAINSMNKAMILWISSFPLTSPLTKTRSLTLLTIYKQQKTLVRQGFNDMVRVEGLEPPRQRR